MSQLVQIKQHLLSQRNFQQRLCDTITKAVTWVIDPVHSLPSRRSIIELSKTEKTMIGTKWEVYFKNEFGIPEGELLDCRTHDIEWDCKFTCLDNWMIPLECVRNEGLCLLAQFKESQFIKAGLFVTKPEHLNKPNQDKKSGISKAGKAHIEWLVEQPLTAPDWQGEWKRLFTQHKFPENN